MLPVGRGREACTQPGAGPALSDSVSRLRMADKGLSVADAEEIYN